MRACPAPACGHSGGAPASLPRDRCEAASCGWAYRLLKAHDLITSPNFIVMKAASEFKDKTTAPNQLWQTDFTYLKIIGWGWYYLSTILDDYSRYIISWKLCTTNNHRLFGPIGHIPPAEAEANYYAASENLDMVA